MYAVYFKDSLTPFILTASDEFLYMLTTVKSDGYVYLPLL